MHDGLIPLDVVLINLAAHRVVGLKASDFTSLDNGRPRPIVSFTVCVWRTHSSLFAANPTAYTR